MEGFYYCYRCNTRMDPIAGCRCLLPYHRKPVFAGNDFAKQWVEPKPQEGPDRVGYELRYTFWIN